MRPGSGDDEVAYARQTAQDAVGVAKAVGEDEDIENAREVVNFVMRISKARAARKRKVCSTVPCVTLSDTYLTPI